MKYIMFETSEGQKMPIIFPDQLTHCFVAGAMQLVFDTLDSKKDLRPKQLLNFLEAPTAAPVSAGFINLGIDITVHGESESLGGLKSVPADAARIICGDAIQFMPDEMAELMLAKLKEHHNGE